MMLHLGGNLKSVLKNLLIGCFWGHLIITYEKKKKKNAGMF